ncbi:conserved hypothetical protein-putative transcriptional regulator [hydrothermal vent metagenome]|uniref:Uncharacterized protein n=1 Tax=hydrothermal vent metagenome TaxID=652676 RepID=A0A3B1DK14_9ZZZZ
MKILIDPNDREFLKRLHRMGAGTVQDICDELEVTATAVRQRLTRLQEQQLVSRDLVREGRGRPHHVYRLTERAIRELGENYADLAMILWREIFSIEEAEVRNRLLGRVKNSLIEHYSSVIGNGSLAERMEGLKQAMLQRGHDVEIDSTGSLPILRENNCPYHELASFDHSICELEQMVFKEVLGSDIELTLCCLDGHSCCEFEASGTKESVAT